ncbi:hypothetical protein L6452_24360 [Arctium lappa]|uniref:Uncharacterized protein n=1 Tax=Arctium lappa TaxID=4217 RepID=A0ACB9A9X0_ARCLA|nr:hypothetical protein L6452_24360 [Arctium lappa]
MDAKMEFLYTGVTSRFPTESLKTEGASAFHLDVIMMLTVLLFFRELTGYLPFCGEIGQNLKWGWGRNVSPVEDCRISSSHQSLNSSLKQY